MWRKGLVINSYSTRRVSRTTESPKFDHEMVWNYAEVLDQGPRPVSNHISVISRLAGRFRCRRPRFDHLFELGICTSEQWETISLSICEEAEHVL